MNYTDYTTCSVDRITRVDFGKESTTKAENGTEVKYKYGALQYKYEEQNISSFKICTPMFDMDYGITPEEKKKNDSGPVAQSYNTPMTGAMPMYSAAKAQSSISSDYKTYKCPIKLRLERDDHTQFYELTNQIVTRCNELLQNCKGLIYRGNAKPNEEFFKDPIARKAKNDDKSIKEDSAPTIWAELKGNKKKLQEVIVPITGGKIDPSLLVGSCLRCKAIITIKIYAGNNGATTFKADVISLIVFNIKPSQARQAAIDIINRELENNPSLNVKEFEEGLEKIKALNISSVEDEDNEEQNKEKEQAQTSIIDLPPPSTSHPPQTHMMQQPFANLQTPYPNQQAFMQPPTTFNSSYHPPTHNNMTNTPGMTPNMYQYMNK